MRRDRLTFAMLVGIPLMQLMLFGYAINADPKALPTAVRIADHSPFSRSLLAALENSEYFRIVPRTTSEAVPRRQLELGQAQFVVNVPAGFGRDVSRRARPALLVGADATDPAGRKSRRLDSSQQCAAPMPS